MIKKFEILFNGHVLLVILKAKNYWNVLQKRIGKDKSNRVENVRVEKVTNRKGNKLYIKWKWYDNSWLD